MPNISIEELSDNHTMSVADAMHLVAREVAKQRMGDMERSIKEGELRTVASFSALREQVTALTYLIEKQSLHMEKATDNLREEIKKDFATKIEVSSDFEKLNTKIDTQWSKLVLIVTTVSIIGVALQFILKFVHVGG